MMCFSKILHEEVRFYRIRLADPLMFIRTGMSYVSGQKMFILKRMII
jgi:hypothetical protein